MALTAESDQVAGQPDAVEAGVRALHMARQAARAGVADAGDWTTGAERVAIWRHVRDARTNDLDQRRLASVSPFAVTDKHDADGPLSATDVDVVHRVASDPGRLTRAWADEAMSEIGEERYTELVGVTAIVKTLDGFDEVLGLPTRALPAPRSSAPTRERPDGVGDVGAWVSQSTGPTRANVSRTFSLVPTTNDLWRNLVDSHYSRGAEFANMSWHRALTRPQTELVAARTTAGNECFY